MDDGLPPGIWAQLETFALHRIPILIVGETGTGKSRTAERIHGLLSHRGGSASVPYVEVNMAAVPKGLAEAELFGCYAGAYNDAVDRLGRFHQADGGVLFLDELHRMKRSTQAKLLTALEAARGVPGAKATPFGAELEADSPEGTFRISPLGAAGPRSGGDAAIRKRLGRPIVRSLLVCATTSPHDIEPELLNRVAGFSLYLPPLRDMRGSIVPRAEQFLLEMAKTSTLRQAVHLGMGSVDTVALVQSVESHMRVRESENTLLSDDARAWLEDDRRGWPGNTRQLRSLVNRAFLLSSGAARRGAEPLLTAKLLQHASTLDVHDVVARHTHAPPAPAPAAAASPSAGSPRASILAEWLSGVDLLRALEDAPSPFHVGTYEAALAEELAQQATAAGLQGRITPRQVVNAFGIRARAEDLPKANEKLASVLAPLRPRKTPAE